ncbi:MAG: histidine ammonia-lyase [Schleiferiaceae bacterium]|nr:histidine ammonia-lyase [Schleiferiaceae bacterium]
MSQLFEVGSQHMSLETLHDIVSKKKTLQLAATAKAAISDCRAFLDQKIDESDTPIYGINTGFGSLCDVSIGKQDLGQLQENLVKSHACGMGETVPDEIVKLMLLLKVQSLSYGYSGVQLQTVERLITFFNEDILPVVYTQGSLGASGDLAPLAHLSLPLLGMGEVRYKGKVQSAASVLKKLDLQPITLQSKEGLALLNGTQFMGAYGCHLLLHSYRLSWFADAIGALSLDAYQGLLSPFDPRIHQVRPHRGQQIVAQRVLEFLTDSPLAAAHKSHVQDPYSFRCMPQVHGASLGALKYIRDVFETEFNSVTDNPTIFMEEGDVLSAGNFHGQPLALALDHLAIAMAELGNISERRVYQLIGGKRQLPPFLVAKPGLNSGFMIPQYTAASIVSQNKQYCTPASVDSIESSNGQEDHVSMGANAATKAYKVIDNLYSLLGIELMNASQALYFRELKTSPFLQDFVDTFREAVPFVDEDRYLHEDMQAAREFLLATKLERDLTLVQ